MAKEQGVVNDGLPIVTCIFTGKEVEVEIINWERLNARFMERMIRAVTRKRKQLRTLALRAERAPRIDESRGILFRNFQTKQGD